MGVTIVDVAKLSGVHPSTVSRVINHSPKVSPVIRKKVIEAVKQLNYRPSSAARVLAGSSNETIGLITEIESGLNTYGTSLLEGISFRLSERGYRLAINTVHWGSHSKQIRELPLFKTNFVDGVILDVHQSVDNIETVVRDYEMPFVFVNPTNPKDYNSIMPDDIDVARQATDYLITRGHTKICYVPNLKTKHISQMNRMKGYMEAIGNSSLMPLPFFEIPSAKCEEEDFFEMNIPDMAGQDKLSAYLKKYQCRGFVVYGAPEASWLYSTLLSLGYKIPEDISIISCDSDPLMAFFNVPLTRFMLDRIEMGKMAVEMLQKRMENEGKDEPTIFVKGSLKEGGSVEVLKS